MVSKPKRDSFCLVVDDEESIRAYICSVLQGEGFQTLEAVNATQALQIVHRLSGGIDLIVTDVIMPGDMSGLDLAHSVRLAFPAVRIVLISGYPDVEGRVHPPGFEFVAKPFTPQAIVAAARRAGSRQAGS